MATVRKTLPRILYYAIWGLVQTKLLQERMRHVLNDLLAVIVSFHGKITRLQQLAFVLCVPHIYFFATRRNSALATNPTIAKPAMTR